MRGLPYMVMATMFMGWAAPARAQMVLPPNSPLPLVVQPAPPPATRIEGFRPEAGSIMTTGHETLGVIRRGAVSVEVRDVRDSRGNGAGGVTLSLVESGRFEKAFLDVDEIPGVLKNIDALLKFTANPTPFKKFEARFLTRGNLAFVAYSNATGVMEYALQVDEVPQATVTNIESADLLRLRELIEQGLQKLVAAGYGSTAPPSRGPR